MAGLPHRRLLLQPLAGRSAMFFPAGLRHPEATLLSKLAAARPEGFARWFAARLLRTLRDLGDTEMRRRARHATSLAEWLGAPR